MNREPKNTGDRSVKNLRQERYSIPYPQTPEIRRSQKQMLDSNRVIGWIVIGALIAIVAGILCLLVVLI